MTGQRQMDATAILDYFAPLKKWLDEQTQGEKWAGKAWTPQKPSPGTPAGKLADFECERCGGSPGLSVRGVGVQAHVSAIVGTALLAPVAPQLP